MVFGLEIEILNRVHRYRVLSPHETQWCTFTVQKSSMCRCDRGTRNTIGGTLAYRSRNTIGGTLACVYNSTPIQRRRVLRCRGNNATVILLLV